MNPISLPNLVYLPDGKIAYKEPETTVTISQKRLDELERAEAELVELKSRGADTFDEDDTFSPYWYGIE